MKRQIFRSDLSGTFSFCFFSLKRTFGITALLSALSLLICPSYLLILIRRILNDSQETVFAFNDTAIAVTTATSVLASIAVVFYLLLNFNFLYSRSASDFFHALPLKRSGILLSRFFASVAPVLLPVFLIYGSMLAMLSLPYIQGDASVILIGLLYTILLLFLSASFALIFLLAASNVVDFLISMFSFHFATLFWHISILILCGRFLRGFDEGNAFPFYRINPLYYSFEGMILDLGLSEEGKAPSLSAKAVIIFLLGAAILLLCLLLFRRRKSEKSGHGYAYRFVYYICMLIVSSFGAFAMGNIFSDNQFDFSFWIFSAIGGVLTGIAYGAVLNRGFKTVAQSAMLGAIAWAMAGILTFSFSVDLFGVEKRIPAAGDIAYVEVSSDWMQQVRFDDPETVLLLHRKAIPEPESDGMRTALSLCYVMKNGDKISRFYEDSVQDVTKELLTLYRSREHIRAIQKTFDSMMEDPVHISILPYEDEDEEADMSEMTLTKREIRPLLEAYLSDLPNATEKTFSDIGTSCAIWGNEKGGTYQSLQLLIEPQFQNTLNALAALEAREN